MPKLASDSAVCSTDYVIYKSFFLAVEFGRPVVLREEKGIHKVLLAHLLAGGDSVVKVVGAQGAVVGTVTIGISEPRHSLRNQYHVI